MTAIDRAALIEAAAEAISYHQGSFILVPEQPTRPSPSQVRLAEAVVPSTVAAALKPIRELHAAGEPVCVETGHTPSRCPCSEVFCEGCGESMPCPTVRLLDEIESSAKGGE